MSINSSDDAIRKLVEELNSSLQLLSSTKEQICKLVEMHEHITATQKDVVRRLGALEQRVFRLEGGQRILSN